VGLGALRGFDASMAPDRVWGSLGLQGFKRGISAFVPPPTPSWTRRPTRRTERDDVATCLCALPRRPCALLRASWRLALPPWGKHPGMSSLVAFATTLHDLHCVPLSWRTWGLRGSSSGAGFATQAVNSSSLLTFGAVFPDAGPTPAARRFRAWLPLLGLSKIVPPPCALVESTPGFHPYGFVLRAAVCRRRPCSALVVFHHLDGLLLQRACRDVAPDCRPWDSPRFRPLRGAVPVTPFRPSELCSPDTARAPDKSVALGPGHVPTACCHAAVTTPDPLPPRR